MPPDLHSDRRWFCKPCERSFASYDTLLDHKQKMRQAGSPKHIHCKHCGQDFETDRAELFHIQTFHPREQNLVCAACGQGPFARIAGLIAHIEQGRCSRLDASVLDELREKQTEFSRKLEILTKEPIKNSFAKYMCPSHVPSAIHKASSMCDTSTPSEAFRSESGPLEPRSVDVPTRVPGSEGVTDWFINLDSAKRARNAGVKPTRSGPIVKDNTPRSERNFASTSGKEPIEWLLRSGQSSVAVPDSKKGAVADRESMEEELRLDRPTSQPPGVDKRVPLQEAAMFGSEIFDSMDPDHPDHPSFSSARYYSPYAEKFLCPKLPCGKVFKTAGGLIGHLRSTAHGNRTYQCPYCLKKFKSLTAIVAHAEQSSVHCQIRDSDNYDAFIHQLTAGIIDVGADRHEDGTISYETKGFW